MSVVKPPKITLKKLRRLVEYKDGQLLWRRRRGARKRGDPCGCVTKDGYLAVRIEGRDYPAHRLIWWLHTGEYPENYIDHIDGNRQNNRIENLREVTPGENNQNTRKTSLTSSRYKGVAKRKNGWQARIYVNGEEIHLGVFPSEWEAAMARIEAEKKYGWKSGQDHNVKEALKELL